MVKPKEQTYKLLPEWVIKQSENTLVISGGADSKYEVGMETNKPSFFASANNSKPFRRSELSVDDQRILEQLVTAEIIIPVLKKSQIIRIKAFGDTKSLLFTGTDSFTLVGADKPYDIGLIVRTNVTYGQLLQNIEYQGITKPHLFVDLAFHHTLSIGPLVFPGETVCVACLQGRISTRWGDETPPASPLATAQYARLATELVATELSRIAQGDTGLTNKTIAWNLKDRVIKHNQLLKVPLCPVCAQNKVDYRGALALPWSQR